MTVRTDLTIDWQASPRLITVASPSVQISVQDLVDTLRAAEDDLVNLGYDQIIAAAGKEELGDGVLVGITATLLNAQITFEARPGPTWVLCTISGGNLVAVDDVGAELNPRVASDYTNVDRTASSSATLSEQDTLDYGGTVWLDKDGGSAGTLHPIGTLASPVDNMSDAVTIAATYRCTTVKLITATTPVTVDVDVSGLQIEAATSGASVTLSAGNDVSGTRFVRSFIGGAASATSDWFGEQVGLLDMLTGIRGIFTNSLLLGHAYLSGDAVFMDCASGIPGTNHPDVDGGLSGTRNVQFRRWTGGLGLHSFVTGDTISVDLLPGRLKIASDTTGGLLKLRGIGEPVTMDGTLDTIDDDGYFVGDDLVIVRKLLANRMHTDPGTGTLTVYDDDDATVFLSAALWEDVAATTPYDGDGADRRNRMV